MWYDLKGVIHHTGGANRGHYISFIRSEDNWIRFNDAVVTSGVKVENVLNGQAVIMSYAKRVCRGDSA